MKAKATGFKIYNRQYSTLVEYEYRGKKYEVEYANDHSYQVTSAKIQHENAQHRIDREIEEEQKPKKSSYEGSAQEAFDIFWEYVNQ